MPPSPDDHATPLDAQALARLHALDPDGRHAVVQRVLSTYETSLQRLLAQVGQARAPLDAATIGHVAHTLKSSSASVGALALAAQCAEVEQAVRTGQTSQLAAQVEHLLALGAAALVAVRAILHP